jgi:hypothetical protein
MGSCSRASFGGNSTRFDRVCAGSQHAPVAVALGVAVAFGVAVALSQPTLRTGGGAHVPSSTDGFGA